MTEVEMAAARRVYDQQTDMSDAEMRAICPDYKPPKKPGLWSRFKDLMKWMVEPTSDGARRRARLEKKAEVERKARQSL